MKLMTLNEAILENLDSQIQILLKYLKFCISELENKENKTEEDLIVLQKSKDEVIKVESTFIKN